MGENLFFNSFLIFLVTFLLYLRIEAKKEQKMVGNNNMICADISSWSVNRVCYNYSQRVLYKSKSWLPLELATPICGQPKN